MKIGMIDADLMDNGTRHPNLALMKLAGYYRDIGNEVSLIYKDYTEIEFYDKVFISKVFTFTNIPKWVLDEEKVYIGGTGFFEDGGENLPYEIEHYMPYYDLYLDYIDEMVRKGKNIKYYEDYLEYSIGFLTRGCFRKCSFCVNKKYEKVYHHSQVEEFLDDSRAKIYLWDDNFLAFKDWEAYLDSLEKIGKPFQFRQGIDIRLINDRKAYRFNNVKWHGDFIFAFDHLKDREIICKNIQLWKKYTNKQPKLYVLSGYESQDAQDIANVFERIHLLMKYGCVPYIMRYEAYIESKYKGMYIQIARWCNQPQFYKKMSFREFCERNQYYHLNPNTLCSAYKAMTDFEKENSEIAIKYFDLKFMYENIYSVNYGYGHRYFNKPECSSCKLKKHTWQDFIGEGIFLNKFLKLYLEGELEVRCLRYNNCECLCEADYCAEYVCNMLINKSIEECESVIKNYKENQKIREDEFIIPDIDINECITSLLIMKKLKNTKDIVKKDIFEIFNADTNKKKKQMKRKLQILAMLDLIYYSRNIRNEVVELTEIGEYFTKIELKKKVELFKRLKYRFPIVQTWIRCGKRKELLPKYITNTKEDLKNIFCYLENEYGYVTEDAENSRDGASH